MNTTHTEKKIAEAKKTRTRAYAAQTKARLNVKACDEVVRGFSSRIYGERFCGENVALEQNLKRAEKALAAAQKKLEKADAAVAAANEAYLAAIKANEENERYLADVATRNNLRM
jgi:hypothetical protein